MPEGISENLKSHTRDFKIRRKEYKVSLGGITENLAPGISLVRLKEYSLELVTVRD